MTEKRRWTLEHIPYEPAIVTGSHFDLDERVEVMPVSEHKEIVRELKQTIAIAIRKSLDEQDFCCICENHEHSCKCLEKFGEEEK